MVLIPKIAAQIKSVLQQNPQGLSITGIVRTVKISRSTAGRYLDILLASGQVEMRRYGMAKIYSLAHRVPLSAVLSITSEFIMQLDNHLRILYVNEPFVKFLGTTRKDLMGKNIQFSPLEPVLDELFESFLKQVKNGIDGIEWNGELFLRQLKIIIACRVTPSVFENGQKGVSVTLEDITDRKRILEALKESEEIYSRIIETANEGVCILDRNLHTTFVNERFTDMLGYSAEEMADHNARDYVIDEDKAGVEAQFVTLRKGIKSRYECRLRHKDGRTIWCLISGSPLLDNTGSFLGSFGMFTDITERRNAEKALQESEEKYRSIIEALPDAVSVVDKNLKVIFANTNLLSWMHILGLPTDIIGRTVLDAFPFLRSTVLDEYRTVFWEGRIVVTQESSQIDDAEIVTETRKIPIKENDDIVAVVTIIRNITERRQAEDALQEREEKYRLLVERSPDAVILHTSGRIVYANPASLSMLGAHSSEDILGHPVLEFVHPDYRGIVSERVQVLTEKSQRVNLLEEKFLRLDGTSIDVDVAAMPVVYHGIPSVQVTFRDITTRKKAVDALRESEEKIRESEEFLRTVITGAKEGIIVYDRDLNIKLWNRFMEEMTGLTAADVVGKNALELFPFHRETGNDLLMMQALEGIVGESADFEFVIRATGKKGWAKSIFSPNHDAHGTIIGVIGMVRDITDQKRTEEALLLANKKLNLLSSVTRHDINNQLSVLRGYLTILEMKHTDLSLNEYLQKATNAVIRISTIIEFTKEYEDIGVNAPVWHECHALVEHAAIQTPLRQVVVKNDIPAGAEIFADPLTARVFHNLMDNAVRHGGKITTIRFSAGERDGSHRMVCEDDGDGVPAEEKEKIFEKGYGKNTGMGLFLAREILAITGISIRETGEPGKGARFEMMVPKAAYRFVDLKMNK